MKLIDKVRNTASRLKTMAQRPTRKHPPQKLQARVRAAVASTADYDDDEPQTKLTSAFVVVLVLHIVAVGGIYAFNQIKASRRSLDAGTSATPQGSTKSTSVPEAVEPTATQPSAPVVSSASSTGTLSGSRPRTHNVKSGDNLLSIAKTYNTTVPELKAINSLESDSIRQGQVLNIPNAKAKPVAEVAPVKKVDTSDAKPSAINYTVKSGDRLIFIAKKYNVSQEELMAYNKISDPNKLHIGQSLKIPRKK